MVFHQRFSSTVRKAQNVSESECESESDLIRLRLVWPDVPLGDIKHGFALSPLLDKVMSREQR